MARHCVQFETARMFLDLPEGAKLSEIVLQLFLTYAYANFRQLSVIAIASEWKDIRFRGSEKTSYKEINKSPQIRFPIPVSLNSPAHKVSLIIQSQLGAVNFPTDEKTSGNGFQYQTDTFLVFQHIRRLIRCIVDFKLAQNDSVSLRNALFMCRSIGARCWDDSPLQMKQLDKIGIAGVRKLVAAGINSIETLELAEPHRIEAALHRNAPFGLQVLAIAKSFPRLRISLEAAGKPVCARLVG
jgi:ATP-dependent DNA helicase HFM1/MER3